MKRQTTTLLVALLLGAPSGARAQDAWPEVVDPAPMLEIAERPGGSDAYILSGIEDMAVLGDSILLIDAQTREVRAFDHEGRFLGRIGGHGEGPGEFEWPTRIRFTPAGILVTDLRLRRQTWFSLDGELARTEPIVSPAELRLSDVLALRGGAFVAETAVFMSSDEGTRHERAVALIDPPDGAIDTVARYLIGVIPYSTSGEFGFLGPRVGAGGDWAAAGDSLVVVVAGDPPVARWWRAASDGLAVGGVVELPLRPEPVTGADRRGLLESANERRRRAGGGNLPRSAEIDVPELWGQVKQVVVSDDGECWVQWDEPRTDADDRWFRIDLDTGRLSRATLPAGFRLLAAARGLLYGFRVTELDVPVPTVFRLRPGRQGPGTMSFNRE